ncbi:MAG: trimethylamine methyltransferase family protein [Chloroflexota bacterium]
MTTSRTAKRRTRRDGGGSAARRQDRAEGAGSGPSTAIWPGVKGGSYRPLSDSDIEQVNQTAMRILAEIGLHDATPRCIETVTAAGGTLTDDGRLLMPTKLVEETLAVAGRGFKLYAQDPAFDLDPSSTRIHLGTSGAGVHMIDNETRQVRDSLLRDLYDMARLANVLPNIHMFQRTVVPRDIPDAREMDLNTVYACLKGTRKPVGTSFMSPAHLDEAMIMFHLIAGDEAAFRARPFVCVSTCFIVPPLRFAEEALGVIEQAAAHGVPLKLVSAGQAGATKKSMAFLYLGIRLLDKNERHPSGDE